MQHQHLTISQNSLNRAWANKKLVAGALKTAHVRPTYSSYEDLLQDGILIYAQSLDEAPKCQDPAVTDRFAFRRVYWRTLDQLRRHQRDEEAATPLDFAYDLASLDEFEHTERGLLIKEALEHLREPEYLVITLNLCNGLSLKEIAKKQQLSYRTVNRLKQHGLDQLRLDLACLKEDLD